MRGALAMALALLAGAVSGRALFEAGANPHEWPFWAAAVPAGILAAVAILKVTKW